MAGQGCGDSGVGSAPVVSVTPEQRAKDVSATTEKTVAWLEKMPADQRQAAVGRSPKISTSLKEVTDPALKARIDALGVHL